MSIKIMSLVWEESPFEHSLLLLHLCLADIANDEGYCWPSVAWIAKKCRLDERYTRKLLNQMVEDGFLEKGVREGKRHTNVYLVRATPVKKDSGNIDKGKKDPLSPKTGEPLSPKTPNPSLDPSDKKNAKARGSLEEVIEYCETLKLPKTDGEWFFCKCEGNGWKNGKEPIKDWKMTVRAWQIGNYFPSQKGKCSVINGKSHGVNGSEPPKPRSSADVYRS